MGAARLSDALLVTLTVRGLELLGVSGQPALKLDAADVALLAELAGEGVADVDAAVARAAARAGSDHAGPLALVEELRARRRLIEDDAADAPTSAADHPTGSSKGEGSVLTIGRPGMGRRPAMENRDRGRLLAITPTHLQPTTAGFAFHRADDTTPWAELIDADLLVLAQFVRARTVADACELAERTLSPALRPDGAAAFATVVDRLLKVGLLEEFDAARPGHRSVHDAEERLRRVELDRARELVAAMQASADERRRNRTAVDDAKMPVFPVQYPLTVPNLALGMLLAYARDYEGGRLHQHYDLDPYWMVRPSSLRRVLAERGPSVFMFSNYVWSTEQNLAMSAKVKQLSPESITVHGGPNTPQYDVDNEAFFSAHPHVDVTVRNEGEVTTAEALAALAGDITNLSPLAHVAGLSYRSPSAPNGVVRTADRDRITDLDTVPSPFLTGVFADYEASGSTLVVLETVRGCPYGCTFCDWGSNTLARLRKFPLERVYAELDWIAEHRMPRVFVADANFGMFARDVEIAEKVAELRTTVGYPLEFHTNYAKNTTKYLTKIIKTLVEAGVTSKGALALQTVDATTLEVVRRSNIKVAKYDELAATFRQEKLPLYTELMIGLPGATVQSFAGDLQMVCDKEITARLYRTELLVNSPMNEPAYREQWQVKAGGGNLNELAGMVGRGRDSLVVSTASYTEADMDTMMRMRQVFGIVENHTVLRHVARFVRHETGLREVDLYRRVDAAARADPERWPLLAWVLDTLADCSAPPLNWRLFFDEVERFLTDELGLGPSSALATVLAVQRAVLPERGRTFPASIELDHDYAAWFGDLSAAKERGEDWCEVVAPLGSCPPGVLEVDDPDDVCGLRIGAVLDNYLDVAWEVQSPVSRVAPAHQRTA